MIDLSRGDTALIQAACARHGATVQQTAYILATGWWETARTMKPVREGFYLGDRADAFRRTLRYWPWYGRGFAQLTWEANYRKAGLAVGADLIADPDLALSAEIAAEILVRGSLEGWFTGKRLGDYVGPGVCDFVNARRVINGLDCAERIAELADEYEDALVPRPDYPSLRRGDRGAAVRVLQEALVAHDRDPGPLDGVFGGLTEAAVRLFQRIEGLKVDGWAGPKTHARLMAFED
jgi:hypothetical protein